MAADNVDDEQSKSKYAVIIGEKQFMNMYESICIH